MTLPIAPDGFNYDARGLFYFEVYPDGITSYVNNDRSSIRSKKEDSLYGAYFRAVEGKSELYCATSYNQGNTKVYKIENLEALADSVGIVRTITHEHKIHAKLSPNDLGEGRYALIDIEFTCGCTLSSANCRIIKEYLKEKYGWEMILRSVGSEPLAQRTITVERNSLSKTQLPF